MFIGGNALLLMSFNSVLVAIINHHQKPTHWWAQQLRRCMRRYVLQLLRHPSPPANCCNVGIIACHAGLPVDRWGLHGL